MEQEEMGNVENLSKICKGQSIACHLVTIFFHELVVTNSTEYNPDVILSTKSENKEKWSYAVP
jgi:hypothetical protein